MSTTVEPLSHLRFEIPEAARILRISRATLYERIRGGLSTTQKDGRRTFITAAELPATELAERTVLHGSIRHLTPDLMVRAVLSMTSLAAQINETSIRASTAASAPAHFP